MLRLGNIYLYQEQKGWTKQSYKDMWVELGATHSACIKKMTGKVKNPGAYCTWLSGKAGVEPHGSRPKPGKEYPEDINEQVGVLPFNLTQDEIDILDEIDVNETTLSRLQDEVNTAIGVDKLGRLIQDGTVRELVIDLYQKGFRGTSFVLELKRALLQYK